MLASAPTRAALACALISLFALGCATESHHVVETAKTESAGTSYAGPRPHLAIGNFQNKSPYMQGMFSTGEDRLGSQAQTILATHLSQANRFVVLDRSNLDEIERESELSGTDAAVEGAAYLLTGQVTEFGRKNTGDRQLFGIAGRGTTQTAYSKVSINVIDARTSRVVYSVQGAGEYELSNREVIGFGGTAGYDATLNGKVLNLSITDAVNKLVRGLEGGGWGR